MGIDILAVDPGKSCGWATRVNDVITTGVQTFDLKRGESIGMRWIRVDAWLQEMLHNIPNLKLLVYEQAHHRGGASTESGIGFTTKICEFAARHDIDITSVHSATLKKHATGKGRANKDDMIAAARHKFGVAYDSDDEADARHILDYAISIFNI